ncbi:hypothetical protein BaRGS_00005046, partial [Batillaria attramentaria]
MDLPLASFEDVGCVFGLDETAPQSTGHAETIKDLAIAGTRTKTTKGNKNSLSDDKDGVGRLTRRRNKSSQEKAECDDLKLVKDGGRSNGNFCKRRSNKKYSTKFGEGRAGDTMKDDKLPYAISGNTDGLIASAVDTGIIHGTAFPGDIGTWRRTTGDVTAITTGTTGHDADTSTPGTAVCHDENRNADRNTDDVNTNASGQAGPEPGVADLLRRAFLAVMSTVGLATVVVMYCMIGALIFKALEGHDLNARTKSVEQIRYESLMHTIKLCGVTENESERLPVEKQQIGVINRSIHTFSEYLLKTTESTYAYDTLGNSTWTFQNALLFTVSLVTTIGYGNIVPSTRWGRVMCLIYAVFGIPLTLTGLTNIGSCFASLVRAVYHFLAKNCCYKKGDAEVPVFITVVLLGLYIYLGALLFKHVEGWSFEEALYFCFVTLSTIGFGDLVPGFDPTSTTGFSYNRTYTGPNITTPLANDSSWQGSYNVAFTLTGTDMQVLCVAYLLIGLSLNVMAFQLMSKAGAHHLRELALNLGLKSVRPVSQIRHGDFSNNSGIRLDPTATDINTNARSSPDDDFAQNFCVCVASTLGLPMLVGLYCVGGAFLFQRLETPTKEGEPMIQKFQCMLQDIGKACENQTADEIQNISRYLNEELKDGILGLRNNPSFDDQGKSTWTFVNAMMFSMTIVTTIGYGNLVPSATGGRVACIIYGVIGIPLCLLCLANIGFYVARLIRFVYARVIFGACFPKEEKARVPVWLCLVLMAIYLNLGAVLFMELENWSYNAAFYYCFITLSTVGFGDLVPGFGEIGFQPDAAEREVLCAAYIFFGLALLATMFDLMQESCQDIFGCLKECCGMGGGTKQKAPGVFRHSDGRQSLTVSELPSSDSGHGMDSADRVIKKLCLKAKLQRVSDIPDDTNLTDRERRWTQMADVVLSNFRERVIEITKQTNWDRRGNSKWTFPGSFLFCVNVVTTIGYGNIAPKTLDGRVACIVYAVFGIPITLLCLSNIGIYMASLVKILYAK